MKIICIGRNYTEHAKELNNPVPSEPLIFLKPDSAYLQPRKPFFYPNFSKDIHYEGELVLKIGRNGRHIEQQFAHKYYDEFTVGIDFTARDLQKKLKEKGWPWEISKGFDGSAAIGTFIPFPKGEEPILYSLRKNGKTVQLGNTKDMIFHFDAIIAYVSQFFTLKMGDLIFTGTPAGVGPIAIGDRYEGYIGEKQVLKVKIL